MKGSWCAGAGNGSLPVPTGTCVREVLRKCGARHCSTCWPGTLRPGELSVPRHPNNVALCTRAVSVRSLDTHTDTRRPGAGRLPTQVCGNKAGHLQGTAYAKFTTSSMAAAAVKFYGDNPCAGKQVRQACGWGGGIDWCTACSPRHDHSVVAAPAVVTAMSTPGSLRAGSVAGLEQSTVCAVCARALSSGQALRTHSPVRRAASAVTTTAALEHGPRTWCGAPPARRHWCQRSCQ